MLRGTQKRMLLIKDTKSGIFDEAYFIIKSSGTDGISRSDMIEEANRIISQSLLGTIEEKKKKPAAPWRFLLGFICGALLSFLFFPVFR